MLNPVCVLCEGSGEIDNEDEESALEWPVLPCPDCDGTGYRLRVLPPQRENIAMVSSAISTGTVTTCPECHGIDAAHRSTCSLR